MVTIMLLRLSEGDVKAVLTQAIRTTKWLSGEVREASIIEKQKNSVQPKLKDSF